MQNLVIHKRIGRYDLSPAEIEEKKQEVSDLLQQTVELNAELAALMDKVKDVKAHIASRQSDANKANKLVRDRWEDRQLECYRLKNFDRRVTQYWSIKFRRIVAEVAFSMDDNQLSITSGGDMVEFETFGEAVQKYTDAINIDGRWFSFGELRADWKERKDDALKMSGIILDNTAEVIQAMTGLTVNTDGLDKAINESDTSFIGQNLIDKPFDREQSTLKSCGLFCDMVAKANEKQLAKLRKSKPQLTDADIAACIAWAEFHDLPF